MAKTFLRAKTTTKAIFSLLISFVAFSLLGYLSGKRQSDDGRASILPRGHSIKIAKDASGGGCVCGCMLPGTLVAIRRAGNEFINQPIETIKPGDTVAAIRFLLGIPRIICGVVAKTWIHEEQEWRLTEICTASGNRFITTDNHPFITPRNKIMRADKLMPGRKILVVGQNNKRAWEQVTNMRMITENSTVYNISLKNAPHNYLVSIDGGNNFALVHNKDD